MVHSKCNRGRRAAGKRAYVYSCRTHWRSSKAICPNSLLIPLAVANAGVIDGIERTLLSADVPADVGPQAMDSTADRQSAVGHSEECWQASYRASVTDHDTPVEISVTRVLPLTKCTPSYLGPMATLQVPRISLTTSRPPILTTG